MGISYSPKIVTSGLVLCLDAANIKSYPGSGTTWFDLSGNGNNGPIVNSPTFSNNVFTFSNALQQGVNIPYKSEWRLIGSNTITYWANGVGDSNRTVVGYEKGSWRGYQLLSNGVAYSGSDGSNDLNVSFTKASNDWVMLAWVIDRSAGFYYLYRNGILQTSSAITHPDLSSSFSGGNLTIGSSAGSATRFYTGSISSVSFYTRALSAAEVQQNFNAIRGRYGI